MHWKVRPYVMVSGRRAPGKRLLVHSLVSVPFYDPVFADSLLPDVRRVYEQARTTRSVAELSAFCGVSLGVTRVIVGDLVAGGRVRVEEGGSGVWVDRRLLERVRDGLRQLA